MQFVKFLKYIIWRFLNVASSFQLQSQLLIAFSFLEKVNVTETPHKRKI